MSDHANGEADMREKDCGADIWRLSDAQELSGDLDQILSDGMAWKADGLKRFDVIQAEFAQPPRIEPVLLALDIL